MKIKLILLITITTLFFAACNESDVSDIVEDLNVEVTFDAVLQATDLTLIKTKNYNRGDAPVYVSGLQITATNLTYTNTEKVDSSFLFADEADINNPMKMIVKAGENQFDGASIATYNPFSTFLNNIDRADQSKVIEDRVLEYANLFTPDVYPIFVEYTGSVSKNISFSEEANSITLNMEAKQGRINVVFEAESDLKYRIIATLKDENHSTIGESKEVVLEDYNYACAFIFNEEKMENDSYVTISIEKSSHNTDSQWEYITMNEDIKIPTLVGNNLTHLINFDGEETTSAGFEITFTPIQDSSNSTQLD